MLLDKINSLSSAIYFSGAVHFAIFMGAWHINIEYGKLMEGLADYRFKRIEPKGVSRIIFFPKSGIFLLTRDGELWAILHYIFDIAVFFVCACLIHVDNNSYGFIVAAMEVPFFLASFWVHSAKDKVIKLSENTVVSDADFKQHLTSKLRSAKKAYPLPQYLCNMKTTKTCKLFWTHELLSVTVVDETSSELVLEWPVAKRSWYRYYAVPVTQLFDRFTGIEEKLHRSLKKSPNKSTSATEK